MRISLVRRPSGSAKASVVAKDAQASSPTASACSGVVQMLRALESGDYTIEEIDAITGPALGRPKARTFRTMDIAGLDVLGHVTRNLGRSCLTDEARPAVRAAAAGRRRSSNADAVGEKERARGSTSGRRPRMARRF